MKTAFQPTTHKPPKRHFTLLTGAQGPGGSESEGDERLDPACLSSPTTKGREPHEGLEYLKCPEPPASPEWPESRESPEFPVCPVSPVSEGQGLEKELEALAAECACFRAEDDASKKAFELARAVRTLEKQKGWRLETPERLFVFEKWRDISQPFLDPTKDYLAEFLAAIPKVRVPKGERDTINEAIQKVLKLSPAELPDISRVPGAPETWRRMFAIHGELHRVSTKPDMSYFLSSRDSAKVVPGLSHQTANMINAALAEVGAVEIVRVGDKRIGGKATEFRYLSPQMEGKEA